MHKSRVFNQEESLKVNDKATAIEAQNAIDTEKVKRTAEQVRRRAEVKEREDHYASLIIPKREQALQVREDLMKRYAHEREVKIQQEQMRKS